LLTGFPVQAGQPVVIKAVEIATDEHRGAHVGPHVLVFPDFFRLGAGKIDQ
jgi:hypothetical protein